MNAYSKIGSTATTHKSRSIDFSDYFSFPQTPKPVPVRKTVPPTKHEQEEAHNCCPPQSKKEDHEGQRFGVILGRSCSVSSSSSSSSSSGFQATMKRAFSIRRSSSVSERYCRIHDQSMAIASDHHELDINIDGGDGKTTEKKKHKGGKILKACKRLLGL
jgi:hypothetical protein